MDEVQWVVAKVLREVVAVEYIQAEDADRGQLRPEDPSDGPLPHVYQGTIFFFFFFPSLTTRFLDI